MKGTVSPDEPVSNQRRGVLAQIIGHSAVRYLIIGGLSFVVDFGLLFLLREQFRWDTGIASATAFLSSLVFNFLVQRKFSFGSEHKTRVSMIRYGILVAANTLATVVVVQLLTPTVLGYMGGKVISTAAMTVWNFFLYQHWVFGKKPTHHGPHEHKHLAPGPEDNHPEVSASADMRNAVADRNQTETQTQTESI